MTIQEAVKLATKHGYRYMGEKLKWDEKFGWFYIATDNGGIVLDCIEKIVLDPKFWEALGKAKNWDREMYVPMPGYAIYSKDLWRAYMQDMIVALIEGKTLEKFFRDL